MAGKVIEKPCDGQCRYTHILNESLVCRCGMVDYEIDNWDYLSKDRQAKIVIYAEVRRNSVFQSSMRMIPDGDDTDD
jgi:predicted Fe-S protein YdhL (DUF1289 family)